MAQKTTKRVKHIPQRTCVGCRLVLPKRTLMRLVRTPEGIRLDPSGKTAGRGAYLHNQSSCWERALKGALANALKMELTEQDREYLHGMMASLPAGEPAQEQQPVQGQEPQEDLNSSKGVAPLEGVEDPA